MTLFDPYGIGGGSSGIAAGLMHPYPGKKGVLSWKGKEGFEATCHLLQLVSPFSPNPLYQKGLFRIPISLKQEKHFSKLTQTESSFDWKKRSSSPHPSLICSAPFFLSEGLTIASRSYLQALWVQCSLLGGTFLKIPFPSRETSTFDAVVFATGAASYSLVPKIRSIATLTKGQILKCDYSPDFPPLSCIGNGYLAIDPSAPFVYLGSTYEHTWERETPCLETAKLLILRKIAQWFQLPQEIEVKDTFAGLRISGREKKYPIVDQIDRATWVITGFGSRGLLYHAYLGKILATAIATNNQLIIPEEVRIPS